MYSSPIIASTSGLNAAYGTVACGVWFSKNTFVYRNLAVGGNAIAVLNFYGLANAFVTANAKVGANVYALVNALAIMP